MALPILSGSVFRIILGVLTDRIGPKKTAVIGMLITMIPLLWGAFGGRSLTELYAIGILLGVAGASFAVALPMASRWYPPHLQGLAMGIAGAGNSGTLFATLFGPRLAEQFGWHSVMAITLCHPNCSARRGPNNVANKVPLLPAPAIPIASPCK